MANIIFGQTNENDKIYRAITDVPERDIHLEFLKYSKANDTGSKLFKGILKAPLEFPKSIAIVYFSSGNIWTRAINKIHNENLTRYRYMRAAYNRQQASSANK